MSAKPEAQKMEIILELVSTLTHQIKQPTLAFLIGGMCLAAIGSKFEIPVPVYKFIVILLLLKVGISAGISVREADFIELIIPALLAVACGTGIVFLSSAALSRFQNVGHIDAMATSGLFGAVSASTLAAGMAVLDEDGIEYEGFIGALYPFMDVAALITAIVIAKLKVVQAGATLSTSTSAGTAAVGSDYNGYIGLELDAIRKILLDTLRSPAISTLVLGLALGMFANPDSVYVSFYQPLFKGLLSILMLIMGIEAWSRLSELRKVAHAYVIYGITAPLINGALGFCAGLVAHYLTGFSEGGVILLSVMAASSSDISGPPTLRAALPQANPSAYVGTSTGIGTPVALLSIPLWIGLADLTIGSI